MMNRKDEGSSSSSERNRNLVTIDGELWDLSELTDALPDDVERKRSGDDDKKKPAAVKQPKDLKNEEGDFEFELAPVPKYEWRQSETQQQQEQQEHQYQHQYQHQQEQQTYHHHDYHDYHRPPPRRQETTTYHPRPEPVQEDYNRRREDPAPERIMVEVFPGIEMPLRGSLETQQAIQRGRITKIHCLDCTLELSCIDDAEHVLCPLCHCITPLSLSGGNTVSSYSYGVGLGFIDDEDPNQNERSSRAA